jgi:hypothetical protein
MRVCCAGAHDGEDLFVHAVRQDIQGAAHVTTPPQDPQLRVPRAVRGLQEGLQNQVAGRRTVNPTRFYSIEQKNAEILYFAM